MFLSSGVKGEGKIFCVYNLVIVAVWVGKWIFFIEIDLRLLLKVEFFKIFFDLDSCVELFCYYGDINSCIR